MVSGVGLSENSKGSQQDRADEYECGAHRQYIELQSKVHSSHLHQSCAGVKASRTVRCAKANLSLHRRRILLHHTVARDSFANVLRFVGNFFQMNGCVRDYAVRKRGAFGFSARMRANKLLQLPEATKLRQRRA